MGKKKANKDEYSEQSIRNVLERHYLSNPTYLINNLYVFRWESDYLAKTRAGYWYEVEIKISLSDFKNDFKKEDKHHALKEGRRFSKWKGWVYGEPRPNYFSYCVPHYLVPKVQDLVPEYAGLISVSEYGYLVTHKAPPKLHSEKLSDDQLGLLEKFYYNWKDEQRRNVHHDEIVADLRGQIRFLKEEFKAVAGYSIEEVL